MLKISSLHGTRDITRLLMSARLEKALVLQIHVAVELPVHQVAGSVFAVSLEAASAIARHRPLEQRKQEAGNEIGGLARRHGQPREARPTICPVPDAQFMQEARCTMAQSADHSARCTMRARCPKMDPNNPPLSFTNQRQEYLLHSPQGVQMKRK